MKRMHIMASREYFSNSARPRGKTPEEERLHFTAGAVSTICCPRACSRPVRATGTSNPSDSPSCRSFLLPKHHTMEEPRAWRAK